MTLDNRFGWSIENAIASARTVFCMEINRAKNAYDEDLLRGVRMIEATTALVGKVTEAQAVFHKAIEVADREAMPHV